MVEITYDPSKPLKPHSYPWWVLLFTVVLISCVVYALFLSPQYLVAAKDFKNGIEAYNKKDFASSISHFEEVLKITPTSKTTKIAIAKSYFANKDKKDDELGLRYLEGIKLGKSRYADLKEVMPIEYQQYFSKK